MAYGWPGSTSHSSFSSARRYLVLILVCCSTVWMSIFWRVRARFSTSPIGRPAASSLVAMTAYIVAVGAAPRRLGAGRSAAELLELRLALVPLVGRVRRGVARSAVSGAAGARRSSIRGSSASETSTWRGLEPSYPEMMPRRSSMSIRRPARV